MAYGQIDPARLEGDDLTQWYLCSPDDIEQERQDAAAQRYRNFFGGNGGVDPAPGFDAGFETPNQDIDPGARRRARAAMEAHAINYLEGDDPDAEFKPLLAKVGRARTVAEIYDLLQPDTFEPY